MRLSSTISFFLTLALLFSAPSALAQDTLLISLTPEAGPGKVLTHWSDVGPSSDAPGGQWDLSDEVVAGVPDTLDDLYVRFLDFQWPHLLLDAYQSGRIDSAMYYRHRDPTRRVLLPAEPFDQHIHYAVGRESDGDFIVVYDTDNDEDLSDEVPLTFPWEGPPMDYTQWFSQTKSNADYLDMVGSLPQQAVSVQLTDGDVVYDAQVLLSITPHLTITRPSVDAGRRRVLPSFWLGAYQNKVGTTSIDGTEYTFWVGSSRLGVYPQRDTQVWIEKGDQRGQEPDSVNTWAVNPFLIEQVVELADRFYRLDEITIDGSTLTLVKVDHMPGVGIRPGMDAPEFQSVTIYRDALKLSDYRGRFVLLDFWSTSCGPCIKDMPDAVRLYDQYPRESFEIIGIAEDDPEWLRQFIEDNGIRWPQVTQDRFDETHRDILDKYRVTGIPAYFLIDPAGKIVDPAVGIRPSALADTLDYLIANWE